MTALCHLCGNASLTLSARYADLRRVTSDCKPWPASGQLGMCPACGTVQAAIDDAWRDECRRIYESYAIYYQGGGVEQPVFDAAGAPAARSDRLLARIAEQVEMPASGRLLDLGCGNGGFLSSFSRAFPGWRLAGSEYDAKYRANVEAIRGVDAFFTCDIGEIPDTFDAISLIHVLEHIESPLAFLQRVREKLAPGGWLIIELPCYVENPVELLIADHASHFDLRTIHELLSRAGFKVTHSSDRWIPKELSLIARNESGPGIATPAGFGDLAGRITWLSAVVAEARAIAGASRHFGLFGTSIAGTWLLEELEGRVQFYVDEDPSRIGRQHRGLPIHAPKDVPAGSDVYVPLPPFLSPQVATRLSHDGVRYHQVPGWE